jgi:hypothetical protein
MLLEETGVPGENHRPEASHWQTLTHIAWAKARIDWIYNVKEYTGDWYRLRWVSNDICLIKYLETKC